MPAKRSRGGQPNNRNAEKHGFYGKAMSKGMRAILGAAAKLDPHDLEVEIALLRTAIRKLVEADPSNLTVLTLALRALVRMMALNYAMSDEQQEDLHRTLQDLLHDLAPARS